MNLNNLIEMSNRYGSNADYILAGGGNTSCKEGDVMYVKGSGAQLSDVTAEQLAGMDVPELRRLSETVFPPGISDGEREADVLRGMLAARLPGSETKRPSVEAMLHAIFPYKYVLHVHPALVNGMTCGRKGGEICKELFGSDAVWIDAARPGFMLAQACRKAFDEYFGKTGVCPQLVFMQNHGIFAAADTVSEIDRIFDDVWAKLKSRVTKEPDFSEVLFDRRKACAIAPALRMLYAGGGSIGGNPGGGGNPSCSGNPGGSGNPGCSGNPGGSAIALFCVNKQVSELVADAESIKDLIRPFTPDHIVYCRDEPLFIEDNADVAAAFEAYKDRKGYAPKIVAVQGLGFFALGRSKKEAKQAQMLFLNAVKIAVYAGSFGGALPMTDELAQFIMGWEAESYRDKASQAVSAGGRLEGRIALITGAAQGFGKGIAGMMAREGAYVAAADINAGGAVQCAAELCEVAGDPYRAVAVEADITDAASVERMVQETILAFGGLDILISNAGVLIAGSLEDMDAEKFGFVTDVNYKGYFLCAKYACIPMKIQNEYAPGYMTDIIEINSKSGLEGSNKNYAYAGSKFGGIGLTQSFALELAPFGIKVNAICPGNLLDGPLWSDPDKGLLRQYLDSGKVPGAKTTADVRKFYEDKVPLRRCCTVKDVFRAVLYVIEQEYETGQAVPVTGGQVMLR